MYHRLLWVIGLFFSTTQLFAQNNYQIDLLVFLHNPVTAVRSSTSDTLLNTSQATVPNLLPSSNSQLQRDAYALSHSEKYTLLLNASWMQSSSHQGPRYLTSENNFGSVKALVSIHQGQYYTLNAQFLVTSQGNNPVSFLITHKQRLKHNTLYYLDNERAGVLIKIH